MSTLTSLGTTGFVPISSFPPIMDSTAAGTTIDGSGEGVQIIGNFEWADGGTHTVSQAGGGQMFFSIGNISTFADSGTTIRIGIQDVSDTSQPSLGDGTFDVYVDRVGGTDAMVAATDYLVAMTGGTKTIASGDVVSVGAIYQSRAGADQLRFRGMNISPTNIVIQSTYPYSLVNTAGTWATVATVPFLQVISDDGILGWIRSFRGLPLAATSVTVVDYGTGSTPDEWGFAFQVPVPMTVNGFAFYVSDIDTADAFELVFYTDPFGTPAAAKTTTGVPNRTGSAGNNDSVYEWQFDSGTTYDLLANTWYGVTLRPTTANTVQFAYVNLAGNGLANGTTAILKNGVPGISDQKVIGRVDNTGAFAEQDVDYWTPFTINVVKLHDGTGGDVPSWTIALV